MVSRALGGQRPKPSLFTPNRLFYAAITPQLELISLIGFKLGEYRGRSASTKGLVSSQAVGSWFCSNYKCLAIGTEYWFTFMASFIANEK